MLTKIELAKELPKFIHAELVDIGERFPFYDDFIKGSPFALVTPNSRAKTQNCINSDYMQTHGDLSLLRNLCARISSFTNYQSTLCDFDWGKERLTVSIIHIKRQGGALYCMMLSIDVLFRPYSSTSLFAQWTTSPK